MTFVLNELWCWKAVDYFPFLKSQNNLCIVHWWQTVRYLIFAVSSLTLHLRFYRKNTGKRNLRKPVFLFSDMTNVTCKENAYLCRYHAFNAFMLSRTDVWQSEQSLLLWKRKMICLHEWNAWRDLYDFSTNQIFKKPLCRLTEELSWSCVL